MKFVLAGVVLIVANVSVADPIISVPELCKDPDPLNSIYELGSRLEGHSFFGIEHECRWSEIPSFNWDQYRTVSAYGYCSEGHGDETVVVPQVFSFETTDHVPGVITIYSSDPNNRVRHFYDCAIYDSSVTAVK